MRPLVASLVGATLIAATTASGCSRGQSTSESRPHPSASSSSRSVTPRPAPTPSAPPYTGPAGTLRGTVHVVGDDPPVLEDVLRRIPDDCPGARNVYGTLFRKGPSGEAADVLITVTDYPHYVPPATDHVTVVGKDCAWNTRTVGMTMGQHLEIVAKDAKGYVPNLIGMPTPANMIPVPGGASAPLRPHRPGRHGLNDLAHLFAYADVFVVKFSTLDVTDTDGTFEIAGVPAGKATVSALLPAALLVDQKPITIAANATTTIDFELKFDEAEYQRQRKKTPPPAPSASSAAAPSAAPSGR